MAAAEMATVKAAVVGGSGRWQWLKVAAILLQLPNQNVTSH